MEYPLVLKMLDRGMPDQDFMWDGYAARFAALKLGAARDGLFPALPPLCALILRRNGRTRLGFRSDPQFAHNRIEVCL